MNVRDNILEKVKRLAEDYYSLLQIDTTYNNGIFKFSQYSAIKQELDFILSEIPIIIEDLQSSKAVNEKLSEANKKLIDKICKE